MKSKVRCWELLPGVFISYPEGNQGFDLIICLSCGQVHSASVARAVYVGPKIEEQLRLVNCDKCRRPLDENWAFYPETYLGPQGSRCRLTRPAEIPPDQESVVLEFPEVYAQ